MAKDTNKPAGEKKEERKRLPATLTIKVGNPGFRGERCGIRFFDGVGSSDDQQSVLDCLALGYEASFDGKPVTREDILEG